MKFVKININNRDGIPFWWEYDESTPLYSATLYNMFGGKNSGNDIRDYEIVDANGWACLDYFGTIVYHDSYKTGWLSPDGKFYGCDYTSHMTHARLVHKCSERELEEKGFIKITKSYKYYGRLEVLCYDQPTLDQIKWFKENYTEKNREEVLYKLELMQKVYSKTNDMTF